VDLLVAEPLASVDLLVAEPLALASLRVVLVVVCSQA